METVFLLPTLSWQDLNEPEDPVWLISPVPQVDETLPPQESSSELPAVGGSYELYSYLQLDLHHPDIEGPSHSLMSEVTAPKPVRKIKTKGLDPQKLQLIPERYRGSIEGANWKCLCGALFDRWFNYDRHVDIHKPPEERRLHHCPFPPCKHKYRYPQDLVVHMATKHKRYHLDGKLLPEGSPKPPPASNGKRKRQT